MKIKTTKRYYLLSMAAIKKTPKNQEQKITSVGECIYRKGVMEMLPCSPTLLFPPHFPVTLSPLESGGYSHLHLLPGGPTLPIQVPIPNLWGPSPSVANFTHSSSKHPVAVLAPSPRLVSATIWSQGGCALVSRSVGNSRTGGQWSHPFLDAIVSSSSIAHHHEDQFLKKKLNDNKLCWLIFRRNLHSFFNTDLCGDI